MFVFNVIRIGMQNLPKGQTLRRCIVIKHVVLNDPKVLHPIPLRSRLRILGVSTEFSTISLGIFESDATHYMQLIVSWHPSTRYPHKHVHVGRPPPKHRLPRKIQRPTHYTHQQTTLNISIIMMK